MKKIIVPALEVTLTNCEEHGLHLDEIKERSIEVFEDESTSSSSVGWSPSLDGRWERTFGERKPKIDDEDVN